LLSSHNWTTLGYLSTRTCADQMYRGPCSLLEQLWQLLRESWIKWVESIINNLLRTSNQNMNSSTSPLLTKEALSRTYTLTLEKIILIRDLYQSVQD
jgi:hypothetical protein